jgi:hypothetical protein
MFYLAPEAALNIPDQATLKGMTVRDLRKLAKACAIKIPTTFSDNVLDGIPATENKDGKKNTRSKNKPRIVKLFFG